MELDLDFGTVEEIITGYMMRHDTEQRTFVMEPAWYYLIKGKWLIPIHLIKAGVSKLDWSKTKTIFIVVFSILNIFLYSLYLNQYHDGENVQVAGRTSIEDLMKQENITYNLPQVVKNDFSHIYADVKSFSEDELEPLEDQSIVIVDNTTIESEMTAPVSIRNEKEEISFYGFPNEVCMARSRI